MIHRSARTAFFILIASVAALLFAYITEYGFGMKPCTLCYYQRYAYMAAIITALMAWILQNQPKLSLTATILALLSIIAEVFIALFHTGVEYGWWKWESACTGSLDYLTRIDNPLPEDILVIPCDQPAFTLLLSMAGWNTVYALIIALISIIILIKNIGEK